MNDFTRLCLKYQKTDKHTTHSYDTVYHQLLSGKRDSVTSVLEIGVREGDSLRVWREYFPNATIHGIEINED